MNRSARAPAVGTKPWRVPLGTNTNDPWVASNSLVPSTKLNEPSRMKKPSSCSWWTCGGGAAGPLYSINSKEPRVCPSVAFAVPMNGNASPSPGKATNGPGSDSVRCRRFGAAPPRSAYALAPQQCRALGVVLAGTFGGCKQDLRLPGRLHLTATAAAAARHRVSATGRCERAKPAAASRKKATA